MSLLSFSNPWGLALMGAGHLANKWLGHRRHKQDVSSYDRWAQQQFDRDDQRWNEFSKRYQDYSDLTRAVNARNYKRHMPSPKMMEIAQQQMMDAYQPPGVGQAFRDPSVMLGTTPFLASALYNLVRGDMGGLFSNLAQGGLSFSQGYNQMRHRRMLGQQSGVDNIMRYIQSMPYEQPGIGPVSPHYTQMQAPMPRAPSAWEGGLDSLQNIGGQMYGMSQYERLLDRARNNLGY